jgi:tetratricopeptide (TPR) repeat protein
MQFLWKAVQAHFRTAIVATMLLSLLGFGIGVPVYADWEWRSAKAALKEGRLDDARRHLRFWVYFFPSNVEVNVLAARAARLGGKFDEAEGYLNHCRKTPAVELEYLLMRVQRGEVDEVAPLLWRCVRDEHPESVLILRTLSGAYMHNLRFDRAYPCLTEWLKVDPDDAEAYYWRGSVQERMSNFDSALEDYRTAVEVDPNHSWARLKYAELYLDKSNPEAAAPHLEMLHEQFPERADVAARLGQCRYLQGRLAEARSLLESAIQHLPKDPALLVYLAKLDLQERRPERAEKWLRQVLSLDPTDTEARYQLVKSLGLQGRDREAKDALAEYEKDRQLMKRASELLQKGTERSATTADELFEIASVFLRSGQDRLSLYWLDRTLVLDPNHQAAHAALAEYFEKKGDQEKATRHRLRLTGNAKKEVTVPKSSSP